MTYFSAQIEENVHFNMGNRFILPNLSIPPNYSRLKIGQNLTAV